MFASEFGNTQLDLLRQIERSRYNLLIAPDHINYEALQSLERQFAGEVILNAQYQQIIHGKSVMYEVLDQHGQKVALAHVFVLPNGSYGGSGKLDPKEIRSGNTIYFL
jgi:hypothetical protein